jgi:dTDP-3-amino-2,3,6-trideoxy-4-keto-D-glucose/dTDP-3-amino-3,4,6-trideoxy-alpha-D-glucose/dTDP-2,6-dideoxy-D-kanosamine transaminase
MIKFWSYKQEYKKYRKQFLKIVDKSIQKGIIFFGDELEKFEKNFTKKYIAKYGIAVGSGTDALTIAIKSINIKSGDEIITAANTAIPTITAIINAGAKPRLVDVGEDYLIDVSKIHKAINSRTKAIIPVHLYGQICDMTSILKIAKKNKIKVIEDCAQSQGSSYKNKYAGTIGDLGCFSFYPTKILGAYSDGGFIFTNDFEIFKKIKRLRFYGIETIEKKKFKNKYYSFENGYNSRLDEIQASILNFKLKKVNSFIKKRRALAKIYTKELSSTELTLPIENKYNKHVYHLYTVSHPKREKLIKFLSRFQIQTRIIYPYPIQIMAAYKNIFTNKNNLKNSLKKSKEIFCLPLYPELSVKNVKYICSTLKRIIKK